MDRLLDASLKTDAGTLVFSPVGVHENEGVFDFNILCKLAEKFSGYLPRVSFCRLYRNDIERLFLYFDSHVKSLVAGEDVGSSAFVPLEGDIQIKCLGGEAVDLLEGYFSISILFNCGKADEFSSNVYFGFETIVDFIEVNGFCDEMKRCVFV